jgi:hypothetical protein
VGVAIADIAKAEYVLLLLVLLLPLLLLLQDLALDAVQTVARDVGGDSQECDIKNYAKVEKIPGGTIEDCKVCFLGGGAPGVSVG